MPKHLTKSQRLDMLAIIGAYNQENPNEVRSLLTDAPPWFRHWPLWSAGENMPGYLPDSPYCLFLTERAARGYCRELERSANGRDYVSDYMPVTLHELL